MEKYKWILEEFGRYLRSKSISTFDYYLKNVKEFLLFLEEGGVHYIEVKPGTGDEYKALLLSRESALARSTVNGKINSIRSFYRFLLKKGIIPNNPFALLKNLKTGKQIPKNILTVEDMGKLLNNFAVVRLEDWMYKSIVEFLYGSSMRIGEVWALKLEDIDFEAGAVMVTNFKNKGKKWKCPATEASLRVLREYMNIARDKLLSRDALKSGRLYPASWKSKSIHVVLNGKLKRECRRLGLKQISTHGFRHSSATHMLKAGAGIREVQMMLGHEVITTTQIYLRIVKEDLKEVLSSFHPREKMFRNSGETEPLKEDS